MSTSGELSNLDSSYLQPLVESAINNAIEEQVPPGLASRGLLRSPTSVVSARNVVVSAAFLTLSLVLADLVGPAVTQIPGLLRAAVSPAPKEGSQQMYTVTVTNIRNGMAVDHADVTLQNFDANGTAQSPGPQSTDSSGHVQFDAVLRPKITYQVIPSTHERIRIFHPRPLPSPRRGSLPFRSGCWRT